jgi:hypothetical protein
VKKGDRVRISATKPDGSPHPHAGKTGTVSEVFSLIPRVTILLDHGQEQGGTFAVVSRSCAEPLVEAKKS